MPIRSVCGKADATIVPSPRPTLAASTDRPGRTVPPAAARRGTVRTGSPSGDGKERMPSPWLLVDRRGAGRTAPFITSIPGTRKNAWFWI